MDMLINIGIIIGILIIVVICIKLLFLIISSVLCVWAEFGDCFGDRKFKKKREKQCEKNKVKATKILKVLKEFLDEYDIIIPNDKMGMNARNYEDLGDYIIEILDEE